MTKNKFQSLAKYLNSSNIKNLSLKKISEQCKVGSIYTVLESELQSTRFGDILIVFLITNDHNKVIKTFLPSSMVRQLKKFYQENDDEALNNQSILGIAFKYVDEVKISNGYTFSKLEWLEQDMEMNSWLIFLSIAEAEKLKQPIYLGDEVFKYIGKS